jgi:hypothetical protein
MAGIVTSQRRYPWTPERTALAAGLVGGATLLLFDHPFSTPAFTLLASAHLTAWSRTTSPLPSPKSRRLFACLGLLAMIPVLVLTGRDLAARHAYDDALGCIESNDALGYANALRRASAFSPGDPYYAHQLAAHLATGHPLAEAHPDPSTATEAVALLKRTLETNPDLEYAHYNLGWLLITAQPAESAEHFRKSAQLAPQRGMVFFGLGCARLNQDDTVGAIHAFATEWLLNPSFAWSPLWAQPPFDVLRDRIRASAIQAALTRGRNPWSELETAAVTGPVYRRLRSGYGVLMGHPAGAAPVDFNLQQKIILPPSVQTTVPAFGWLDGGFLLDFLDHSSR